MNQTIIQERSGLNQFLRARFMLVDLDWSYRLSKSALMLTVFQSQLIYFLMHGRLWLMIATLCRTCSQSLLQVAWLQKQPSSSPVFLVYSVLKWFYLALSASIMPEQFCSPCIQCPTLSLSWWQSGISSPRKIYGMGRALMAALVGLIIAMVRIYFQPIASFDYMISIAMVLVFSGLIAWDNQDSLCL